MLAANIGVIAGGAFKNDYFRALWPVLRFSFSEDFVAFFETLDWNH